MGKLVKRILSRKLVHQSLRNFGPVESHQASWLCRFAKSVLAYVGVGIFTVGFSRITVHTRGKEMATAEMRAAWQRTAATYLLHEDSKRTFDQRGTKPDAKCNLSEAVNSHYFMDRNLDCFHVENEAELQTKRMVEATESGSKSLQSDWQSVDSPCGSVLEETVKQKLACANWKGDELNRAVKLQQSAKDADTSVPRWRHANKGELAALIARKSSEDMGNCDLPPPLSPAAKELLGSSPPVLQGELGTQSLPSSPFSFRSVGSLESRHKRKTASPLELAHAKRTAALATQAQQDNRPDEVLSMNWKALEGNSAKLGEALCRSQTRAREAEKIAAEAISERDQLQKLFFREASVSLTYKHCIKYLEAENALLRLRAGELDDEDTPEAEQDMQRNVDQRKHSKRQDLSKVRRRRHSESAVAVVGCTVGLAFALGVSLAGAGLVFGCTMGWILIAF